MDASARDKAIDNYRSRYLRHRTGPELAQVSAEGQLFRFVKLSEIGNLSGQRVIDIGCGIGDFYTFLRDRFGSIDYLGVDIVPELVRDATARHPDARFLCRDILDDPLDETADWVLISMMFNNKLPHDGDAFLREMVTAAFSFCRKGLAFNFLSTYVNFRDEDLDYHNPVSVFDFCVGSVTRKAVMHHHYERCDVAVFLYR